MKVEEFEKLYEEARDEAIKVARRICGDEAEDAVNIAAMYFLERLDSYREITKSLFIQVASLRARDLVRPDRAPRNHELPVGDYLDLTEVERSQMPERGRHTPAKDPSHRVDPPRM